MNYQIELILKSPVCISNKQKVENTIQTLDFIPGQTIRGALAEHFLRENNNVSDTDLFASLFLNNKVVFPDCYIDKTRVIPLTAMTCKYKPGFREHPDKGEKHGALDFLIPLSIYEFDENNLNKNIFECQYDNAKCKAPMEKMFGYYKKVGENLFQKRIPTTRLLTHNRLSDYFESSRKIYSIQALEEGQVFYGELDKETFELLKKEIGNVTIYLGTARTRGLGEVQVNIGKTTNFFQRNKSDIKERYFGLKKEFEKNSYKAALFSVTLSSTVIVRDEILRYKSYIDIKDIFDSVFLSDNEKDLLKTFSLVNAWTSTQLIMGWNNRLKLPKENQIGITRGSVFLFASKDKKSIDEQKLIRVLGKIEQNGIGERRNEGFGKVRICDEFHWEVLGK